MLHSDHTYVLTAFDWCHNGTFDALPLVSSYFVTYRIRRKKERINQPNTHTLTYINITVADLMLFVQNRIQ